MCLKTLVLAYNYFTNMYLVMQTLPESEFPLYIHVRDRLKRNIMNAKVNNGKFNALLTFCCRKLIYRQLVFGRKGYVT